MGAAHPHRSTWVDAQAPPAAVKRAGYTVLPLAVLGSIAVTLSGTAAGAAEPTDRRDTVTPGDRSLATAAGAAAA
ncbi:MAG TPA: hypothetical protein PLL22_05615, partial [Microbacteriaceae bacterium]|nr:hypothetical protein [Microbacteriaceae bacterium]